MDSNGVQVKDQKDAEKLKAVRFNPLVDYGAQIHDNFKPASKKLGDTSLASDLRVESLKVFSTETRIRYKENMGNFEHSKVVGGASNSNDILSMKHSSQSLFIWILFNLEYRNDTIRIEGELLAKTGLPLATGTLKEAIVELENANIIRRVGAKRTLDYWLFFINPQIIWKGDAKRFYKDVLKYHPEYEANSATKIPSKKSRKRRTSS